jgi:hypothetical protein
MADPLEEAPGVRAVEDREPLDRLAVVHRGRPGDGASPVVAGEEGPLGAALGYQLADVARQRLDAVGGDAGRLRGEVVAAHVGRDHAEAGLGQGRDLVVPAVPELGKAVQQDDQRPLARFDVVEPHLAQLGVPVPQRAAVDLGHAIRSVSSPYPPGARAAASSSSSARSMPSFSRARSGTESRSALSMKNAVPS